MLFELGHWFAEDAGLICLPRPEELGQDRETLDDAASIVVTTGMNHAVRSSFHPANEARSLPSPCRQLQQTLCNGSHGLLTQSEKVSAGRPAKVVIVYFFQPAASKNCALSPEGHHRGENMLEFL